MRSSHIAAVVDDDEAVRIAMFSLVRSLGFQAIVFDSARTYLLSPHITNTTCLITDVLMPGMSGIEMHDRLLVLGHAPPTIFVTAFPTADIREKVMANGALAVLEKPVDVDDIAFWLDVASRKR